MVSTNTQPEKGKNKGDSASRQRSMQSSDLPPPYAEVDRSRSSGTSYDTAAFDRAYNTNTLVTRDSKDVTLSYVPGNVHSGEVDNPYAVPDSRRPFPADVRQPWPRSSYPASDARQPYVGGAGDVYASSSYSSSDVLYVSAHPTRSRSPYAENAPTSSKVDVPHEKYAPPAGQPAAYASTSSTQEYGRGSSGYSGPSRAGGGGLGAFGRDTLMGRAALSSRPSASSSSGLGRPGTGGGGMLGMLMNLAPGQSISALLSPPPPPFLRPPAPGLAYSPFEITTLLSLGDSLDKGFPIVAPPSQTLPHPFATHDVHEDDWLRFLHDVRIASSAAPMGMNWGITGPLPTLQLLISKAVESSMKDKKSITTGHLIDHWNTSFFHPRRMFVILARGSMTYSGPQGVPPPDMAYYSAAGEDYDTISSDSDDDYRGQYRQGTGRRQRIGDRRRRREMRRAEKRARWAGTTEKRNDKNMLWRLIIMYKPTHGY